MRTEPQILAALSKFFEYSADGWAYALSYKDYDIKDVQLYEFEPDRYVSGMTLVMEFKGCADFKIRLSQRKGADGEFYYEYSTWPYQFPRRYMVSIYSPHQLPKLFHWIKKVTEDKRRGRMLE